MLFLFQTSRLTHCSRKYTTIKIPVLPRVSATKRLLIRMETDPTTPKRIVKPRKPRITTKKPVGLVKVADLASEEKYASLITSPPPSALPVPKFKRKSKKPAPPPLMTPTTIVLLTTPPPTAPSTPAIPEHTTSNTASNISVRMTPPITPMSPFSVALLKAEQRGGTLLQVPTGALPLWSCYKQHRFSLPMDAVQAGAWCEECQESLGERAVRLHVERRKLDYRCEISFPSLSSKPEAEILSKQSKSVVNSKCHLRFDFYIVKYRLLVEVDGEQHFGSGNMKGSLLERLESDQAKDEWARAEKFNLLRIPFWELSMIEALIDSTIARIHAGESCLFICADSIILWRKQAITALRNKKRTPPAPIPVDARQRATEARQAIRDLQTAEVNQASIKLAPPPGFLVTLA